MSDTKEDIPVFDKKVKPKAKSAKVFKMPNRPLEKVSPTLVSSPLQSELSKKVVLIQVILLMAIAATIWLYLKNNDLIKVVTQQSLIIKSQSEKLQNYEINQNKLQEELKSLNKNFAQMKNRQESVEKYTIKSLNKNQGESVVEENIRKSKEVMATKATLTSLVKENEKLLSINSEISENNKMLHSEHQELLKKFMDLIKTFDPECKTGKCLTADEINIQKLQNKDDQISGSALELYKAKALLKKLKPSKKEDTHTEAVNMTKTPSSPTTKINPNENW